MAIYHLRLKLVGRALGRAARPGGATRRSAVAAAAYRSGERLYDESQGKAFEFDKPDVRHTEILAPDGAPAWVFSRQELWNAVERSEKRYDAQLAREVGLTLPRELSRDQQIALVRAFVRDEFVAKGMVADFAIHEPEAADGSPQPHAHVLCTTRRLDASTLNGFSALKERDWNERPEVARAVAEARKQFNNTALPGDEEALKQLEAQRQVNLWRAGWARYANAALEEVGSMARIDHRTLEAQGIQRAPQISLGLARHLVEKAYDFMHDRITHWVAVKKRASLYEEVEAYRRRDPTSLTAFLFQLSDLAESFAASFRKPPDIPEVPLEPGR